MDRKDINVQPRPDGIRREDSLLQSQGVTVFSQRPITLLSLTSGRRTSPSSIVYSHIILVVSPWSIFA